MTGGLYESKRTSLSERRAQRRAGVRRAWRCRLDAARSADRPARPRPAERPPGAGPEARRLPWRIAGRAVPGARQPGADPRAPGPRGRCPPAGRQRRRLQACVQGHGTVARLNDQEFAVVFDEAGNAANVGALCEGLCAVMAPSLTLQGRQVHGQLSIGIALFPQDGADAATLLCLAGEARACARENGGGKYQFFSARMNQRSLARTSMEMALRLAIARDELQLQYQPLADLQSGAIAGMEALLRWQPPSGEMADAGHFLPMAEDLELIVAIGDWVLRRACRDLRACSAAGREDVRIAINVAPRQFHEQRYAAGVAAILAEF